MSQWIGKDGNDLYTGSTMKATETGMVKCAGCREPRHYSECFRCFYCKSYYCAHCAKKHFEAKGEANAE